MQIVSIKCPNCGADVYIEENKTRCFCSHCGGQILIDDGINRSINVYVDQAKERELDLELMKYKSAIERLDKRQASLKKFLLITLMISAISLCLGVVFKACGFDTVAGFLLSVAGCAFGVAFFVFPFFMDALEKRDKLDHNEDKKPIKSRRFPKIR